MRKIENSSLEFPGGPAVRTSQFHCHGPGGKIPGQGTKIPQAAQHSQKNKEGKSLLILSETEFGREIKSTRIRSSPSLMKT